MEAGRLDRRITVLRRTLTRNEHGEQVESFSEYTSVWGQKLDITGREYFTASQTIAENSARFRLRYTTDLLRTDRLSVGGVEYDIVQIAEIGRGEALDIFATARL